MFELGQTDNSILPRWQEKRSMCSRLAPEAGICSQQLGQEAWLSPPSRVQAWDPAVPERPHLFWQYYSLHIVAYICSPESSWIKHEIKSALFNYGIILYLSVNWQSSIPMPCFTFNVLFTLHWKDRAFKCHKVAWTEAWMLQCSLY